MKNNLYYLLAPDILCNRVTCGLSPAINFPPLNFCKTTNIIYNICKAHYLQINVL